MQKYQGNSTNAPRETFINDQRHMLAYINPFEEDLLRNYGGTGQAGPGGVPAFRPSKRKAQVKMSAALVFWGYNNIVVAAMAAASRWPTVKVLPGKSNDKPTLIVSTKQSAVATINAVEQSTMAAARTKRLVRRRPKRRHREIAQERSRWRSQMLKLNPL
jgi:hypothetical protein